MPLDWQYIHNTPLIWMSAAAWRANSISKNEREEREWVAFPNAFYSMVMRVEAV
ncbi:hypothetical protein KDK_01170 [Dictyobacter kobayashii]|uniref:Uncharacterized protein n=1 Tax=Dictyobacter kobayashii TaxID=2014872 RepID=A0A402AAY2_9CHLR|nr:hypothetical protein KDK_01170 [Dictyobacter kobayashii]